ncbi:type VI secretion system baseplate subunit TssE [Vibrio hyugaensis]|uniref:type VI secretion system baseplate subunit TssE n=1 Tax=Vibrio hyugaensis TaxID=1534743 RepID=UPI000CE3C07D|nr:type VI secretion system baseplate subunit TssE [Vibrio hyugaensis]
MALEASLLDKLIDSDPSVRDEKDFPVSSQSLLNNLLRDVEAMLNSRIGWRELPEDLLEVRYSILNYGLPDFSSMPYSSQEGQSQLCGIVCDAIKEFEPRLESPFVTILDEKNATDRTLRLKITATCLIGSNTHEVTFNSEVEPVSLGMKLSRTK